MDFDLPLNCLCFNLRKAARRVTRQLDGALKPAGLNATQFTALNAIGGLKDPGIGDLARVLDTDRTTLTRNLALLERQGLISLTPGEDLRRRQVRMTPKGRAALARAMPLWRTFQNRLVTELSSGTAGRLLRDLNRTGAG